MATLLKNPPAPSAVPVEAPPSAGRAALAGLGTPLAIGALLALLALIPYLAALYGTPPDWYFRGSLRPSTDEGLYLTATRLGADGAWLWHDPFAVQAPPPILIYPSYFLAGHLGALLHLAPRMSFILYHPLAVLVLFGAVWRLAGRCCVPGGRRWLLAFAFGASGLYWLDALLSTMGRAPVSLTRMGMQQLSGFSLGLIVAHEAIGIAGQILAFTAVLDSAYSSDHAHHRRRRRKEAQRGRGEERGCPGRLHRRAWRLEGTTGDSGRFAPYYGVGGALLVGLTFPVLLPLTLAVVFLFALLTVARHGWRRHVMVRVALTSGAIAAVGVPFGLYYWYVFSHGVWRVFQQLGALNPVEGLLTWGVFLPLALWGWRAAPAAARPLADLLALWCVCAVIGTALNMWQGSRLATGITLPIGMLMALGLLRYAVAIRRRWLMILGLGLACQYLFLLSALLQGNATHLYNTPRQEQAIRWLAAHAGARDVVLAPFSFGNVLPEASVAHVVAGEFDQTYDYAVRYPQLLTFYNPHSSSAARRAVLEATGATFVVYDAQEPVEGTFDPRGMPGLRTVFASGEVAVLRVGATAGR